MRDEFIEGYNDYDAMVGEQKERYMNDLREKVRRMLCGFTLGVSTNSEANQVINLILDELLIQVRGQSEGKPYSDFEDGYEAAIKNIVGIIEKWNK